MTSDQIIADLERAWVEHRLLKQKMGETENEEYMARLLGLRQELIEYEFWDIWQAE